MKIQQTGVERRLLYLDGKVAGSMPCQPWRQRPSLPDVLASIAQLQLPHYHAAEQPMLHLDSHGHLAMLSAQLASSTPSDSGF